MITIDGNVMRVIGEMSPVRAWLKYKDVSAELDRSGVYAIKLCGWVWVYYDWCCNPVGIGYEKPDGIEVDKFTTENLDFSWTTPQCAQRFVDYLNREGE